MMMNLDLRLLLVDGTLASIGGMVMGLRRKERPSDPLAAAVAAMLHMPMIVYLAHLGRLILPALQIILDNAKTINPYISTTKTSQNIHAILECLRKRSESNLFSESCEVGI
jgi:hypothetical protein